MKAVNLIVFYPDGTQVGYEVGETYEDGILCSIATDQELCYPIVVLCYKKEESDKKFSHRLVIQGIPFILKEENNG